MLADRKIQDGLYPWQADFINKLIAKHANQFRMEIEDLKTDNIKDFLISILKSFFKGEISSVDIVEIGSCLTTHMVNNQNSNGDSETFFLDLTDNTGISVSLNVIEYMYGVPDNFLIFPEDAVFFIKCLELPDNQAEKTNAIMQEYVQKLEGLKRYKDGIKKGYLTEIDNTPINFLDEAQDLSKSNGNVTKTYIDLRGEIHTVYEYISGGYSISILSQDEQEIKNINYSTS